MDVVKVKEKLKKLKEKREQITQHILELEEKVLQSKINNFKKLQYCSIFMDIFSKNYQEKIMKSKDKTIFSNYYCRIHKCNHNDCPVELRSRKYVNL